jgi:single-strand DNA-binding protein
MASTVTLIGNTTSDFELRYTTSGKAVANVTIAVADRKFDKATNEWNDGDTWFARCSLWGESAEFAASSILKGTRVIASGRIGQRDWEDKDGNKRTSVEVTLDEIGPSLRYATAQVTRSTSSRGSQSGAEPSSDSWATNTTPVAGSGGYGANHDGEEPF